MLLPPGTIPDFKGLSHDIFVFLYTHGLPGFFLSPLLIGDGLRTIFSNPKDATFSLKKTTYYFKPHSVVCFYPYPAA
jgi:hypothetical protein